MRRDFTAWFHRHYPAFRRRGDLCASNTPSRLELRFASLNADYCDPVSRRATPTWDALNKWSRWKIWPLGQRPSLCKCSGALQAAEKIRKADSSRAKSPLGIIKLNDLAAGPSASLRAGSKGRLYPKSAFFSSLFSPGKQAADFFRV